MFKIAVVGLAEKKKINLCIDILDDLRKTKNIYYDKYLYSNRHFDLYDSLNEHGMPPGEYDAVVSLGGDGTFLYTSRIFAGTDVPVMGINIGQLGFNTNIEIENLREAVTVLVDGKCEFEYRCLLDVTIEGDNIVYAVLNDAVISHAGISRMIRLKVDLEGHSVCDFSGDGIIISSPTGSTAYNLSAGGPILHPSVEAFVMTPICPHTLAIRPYIIPFSENINIVVEESSAQPQITLDGQKIILLNIGHKIKISKSEKRIKVVKSNNNFSEILKKKLGWMV